MSTNLVKNRKKHICKRIVTISDKARNLNALLAINNSKTIRCVMDAIKYNTEVMINVGCSEYFKVENVNIVNKKRTLPISISTTTNKWKDEMLSLGVLWIPRFRSVKVVPEVRATPIKTPEVMIIAKYDLLNTPNSLL